jgi:hypothetical protein
MSFHSSPQAGHRISRKSVLCRRSKESRNGRVFGYVAKDEDRIIRETERAVLLRLLSGALCALGTSTALYLAQANRSLLIPALLILPTLQAVAMGRMQKWIRKRCPPHLWIRGYSPAPILPGEVIEEQRFRRESIRDC